MKRSNTMYAAFEKAYPFLSEQNKYEVARTVEDNKSRMVALINFRKAIFLKGLTAKQIDLGFDCCYELTKLDLHNNEVYSLELNLYFIQLFRKLKPELNLSFIQKMLPDDIERRQYKPFVYTEQQIAEAQARKSESQSINKQKTSEKKEKQYLTKRFIGPTGIIESIMIEVDEVKAERQQYDYWNNENYMYDNIDYREYQDFYDNLY